MNILSLSYGKDSLACLGACELLGWKIDRIVHAEVWATDTIPADLPPMVEFKKKADKIIKERCGIEVEHYSAKKVDKVDSDIVTYEKYFYQTMIKGKHIGAYKGFPMTKGQWCTKLKLNAYPKYNNNDVQFLGIAIDEPNRFHNLDETHKSPLVEIGWNEADCKQWCIDNDLLSPIYTDTCMRGGCWFCHNQGVNQLRELRHNYPDLWALLLKWDKDSPVTFHADGHTVYDFDRRFKAEDEGFITQNDRFRWVDLENPQYNIFQYITDGNLSYNPKV